MAQSPALVETLKKTLRAHSLTYADVARGLKLSEASVKRMFALNHLTLERMDRICALMQMELTDLLREFDEAQRRITHLSEIQESELVADQRRLLVAVCVRNHWSFDDIVAQYDISETECIQHLAYLDRLGLIDLLPGNRIRLRVAEDFRWLAGGPIEQFFENTLQQEFLATRFSQAGRMRMFLVGMLSQGSRDILLRRLEDLANDFSQYQRNDCRLPLNQRTNFGMVLAFRRWEWSAFQAFRKEK